MATKTRSTPRPRLHKPLTIEVSDRSYQLAAEILVRSTNDFQQNDQVTVRPPGELRAVNE